MPPDHDIDGPGVKITDEISILPNFSALRLKRQARHYEPFWRLVGGWQPLCCFAQLRRRWMRDTCTVSPRSSGSSLSATVMTSWSPWDELMRTYQRRIPTADPTDGGWWTAMDLVFDLEGQAT